jgi:hypothetical protein
MLAASMLTFVAAERHRADRTAYEQRGISPAVLEQATLDDAPSALPKKPAGAVVANFFQRLAGELPRATSLGMGIASLSVNRIAINKLSGGSVECVR